MQEILPCLAVPSAIWAASRGYFAGGCSESCPCGCRPSSPCRTCPPAGRGWSASRADLRCGRPAGFGRVAEHLDDVALLRDHDDRVALVRVGPDVARGIEGDPEGLQGAGTLPTVTSEGLVTEIRTPGTGNPASRGCRGCPIVAGSGLLSKFGCDQRREGRIARKTRGVIVVGHAKQPRR